MLFKHYIQLSKYHKKLFAGIIFSVTAITCGLSIALLYINPIYSGTAKILMKPTEAEISFTRGWVMDSQFSPASVMAQTHMEYIMSRPVLERTVRKIIAELPPQPPPEGFKAKMSEFASKAKQVFWKTYNTLNYGKYIPLTPFQDAYAELEDGVDIEIIESSYLLEIEVCLKYQEAVKIAANELANGYVERVFEQTNKAAKKIETFLNQEISNHENVISTLVSKEFDLRKKINLLDLQMDNETLNSIHESEQAKMSDLKITAQELATRLKSLKGQKKKIRAPRIEELIEETLIIGEAKLKALNETIPKRKSIVEGINEEKIALIEGKRFLEELQRSQVQHNSAIKELRKRKLVNKMAQSKVLSQVQIIDPAVTPRYPKYPKVLINTIVGFIAGTLIAVFVLVVIESTSKKVKTSSDLRRIVGERYIGWIPHKVISKPSRNSSYFNNFGSNIERQLSIYGGFENQLINITGFGNIDVIKKTGESIKLALEKKGFHCQYRTFPETVDCKKEETSTQSKQSKKNSDSSVSINKNTLTVRNMGNISAVWQLEVIANISKTLICIVPSGEFFEETILEFQEKALICGLDALTFIMVEC